MHVELVAATIEDAPALANLSRYYVHDLSEYVGFPCAENGIIGWISFADSWDNPDHHVFLIRVDGELAGFAKVDAEGSRPEIEFSVAEFFILRKFRRRGVGRQAAFLLFDRLRGQWEIVELLKNTPAQAFWQATVATYTGGDFDSEQPNAQRFHNELTTAGGKTA